MVENYVPDGCGESEARKEMMMSDVLSALRTAAVVMEHLPELPGYNGSMLTIDDTEAERIAQDVCAGVEALECARTENAKLRALIELIFASTVPYNDGEPTFIDKVTDMWAELNPATSVTVSR